jgi:hypothetical protein
MRSEELMPQLRYGPSFLRPQPPVGLRYATLQISCMAARKPCDEVPYGVVLGQKRGTRGTQAADGRPTRLFTSTKFHPE